MSLYDRFMAAEALSHELAPKSDLDAMLVRMVRMVQGRAFDADAILRNRHWLRSKGEA